MNPSSGWKRTLGQSKLAATWSIQNSPITKPPKWWKWCICSCHLTVPYRQLWKKHGSRIQLKSFWVHMRNFPNVYVNSFIPMVVILWLSSARNKICKLFSKNTFLWNLKISNIIKKVVYRVVGEKSHWNESWSYMSSYSSFKISNTSDTGWLSYLTSK